MAKGHTESHIRGLVKMIGNLQQAPLGEHRLTEPYTKVITSTWGTETPHRRSNARPQSDHSSREPHGL